MGGGADCTGATGRGIDGIDGIIGAGACWIGAVGRGIDTGAGVGAIGAVGTLGFPWSGERNGFGPAVLPIGCGPGELPPNCMTLLAPETQKPALEACFIDGKSSLGANCTCQSILSRG